MRVVGIIALVIGGAAVLDAGEGEAVWWSLRPLDEIDREGGVDGLIEERLGEEGLRISEPAEMGVLVRRVCYDLTGLPPEAEVVARFRAGEGDYAAYVDELLASPAYGERWARHWLDVARYGESNGFEYNEPRRSAWPYRDWVIGALNSDLGYDEFVRLQIAGDVLLGDGEGAAAVGFLVAGVHNTVLGADPVMKLQGRLDEMEEMVGVFGQAFLGMTVQCARCHDHKFDPVSSREYYRLSAALSGVWHGEREVEQDGGKRKLHTVVARDPGAVTMFARGDAGSPGEVVAAGGVGVVPGGGADFGLGAEATDADRRRALAAWVTGRGNALFARVAVNRVWHYHFGTGIVDTPSDFGKSGGVPSHPELLEWLAGWFVENGYSLKALHRLIVTSATYRQGSAWREGAGAIDAGSRLLWRYPPQRVEGEVVRDSMLAVAGVLNREMGGPGFEDTKEAYFNAGRYYQPFDAQGEAFRRRTIYRFSPRGGRGALLDTFDCPDPSATAPRRMVTTTPLQVLSLRNDPFVWRTAGFFAERLRREAGRDVVAQVARGWVLALGRVPDAGESELAVALAEAHGLEALCRALFSSDEFTLIE